MREIHVEEIIEAIAKNCIEINTRLDPDLKNRMLRAAARETSKTASEILHLLVENGEVACRQDLPLCQDTGTVVAFVELGTDVVLRGGSMSDALCEGIRRGYQRGYLRKSIVGDPLFERKNTGDNTPGIIHMQNIPGDRIIIYLGAKGGGSENMSALKMMKPSDGNDGVRSFVLDTVKTAGPNACPPLVVGVGIGGNFEMAALLAKKALFRPLDEPHPNTNYAQLENELLDAINATGIGPQGLGGKTTAFGVKIETYPCHIASLPVAVNLNCHASRHRKLVI